MNSVETLELKIAKFLRYGVVVAGLIMLAGWITMVSLNPDPFFNFQTYDHIPLRDLYELHVRNEDWGVLTSYVGLMALISLPVIRVILTAVLFLRQKEYLLALISFVVLVGLIFGMALGIEF